MLIAPIILDWSHCTGNFCGSNVKIGAEDNCALQGIKESQKPTIKRKRKKCRIKIRYGKDNIAI
jgi:hypothetical protein